MIRSLNIKKALASWLVATAAYDLLAILAYRVFHHTYNIGTGPLLYRPFMIELDTKGIFLLGAYHFIITGTVVAGYLFWRNNISRKELREGAAGGMVFGLFVWLFGIVVTLLHVYLATNMELPVIMYWMFMNLINYLLTGAIAGAIYRDA